MLKLLSSFSSEVQELYQGKQKKYCKSIALVYDKVAQYLQLKNIILWGVILFFSLKATVKKWHTREACL